MDRYEEWLSVVQEDLKAANKLISGDDAIILPAAFFAQQSAEKALKAFLIYKKQPLKRTHDLVQLVKGCIKFDAKFESLLDCALHLNPYVTQSRYPDAMMCIPSVMAIQKLIDYAMEILQFVEEATS